MQSYFTTASTMWRRCHSIGKLTTRLTGIYQCRNGTFHGCKIGSRSMSSNPGSGVPYKTLQSETKSSPKVVPPEADVVVIGGGSIGCSTLYHLTKLGVNNVVLLERDQLTAGTTWHTAGILMKWNYTYGKRFKKKTITVQDNKYSCTNNETRNHILKLLINITVCTLSLHCTVLTCKEGRNNRVVVQDWMLSNTVLFYW